MEAGDLTPPDRHFSLFLKDITSNINWRDFGEVLEAFERRITSWYLEPAEYLIEDMPGNDFIITSTCCALIDTLSQFRAGEESHDAKTFKQFTEDHFRDFDRELPRTIPAELVIASTYPVDTVSEAFYSGFRCGLTHSGTILAFGGHSLETDGELYEIWFDRENPTAHCYDKETGEEYPFIILNPLKLVEEVESAFNHYLKQLRQSSDASTLRRNFARKIEYDFGEYGSKLLDSLEDE